MSRLEIMSGRTCYSCGKGAMQARFVSHANNKTKRTMGVNLRPFKMPVKGEIKTVKLCVKCLRIIREEAKGKKLVAKAEQILAASQKAQKEKTFG